MHVIRAVEVNDFRLKLFNIATTGAKTVPQMIGVVDHIAQQAGCGIGGKK